MRSWLIGERIRSTAVVMLLPSIFLTHGPASSCHAQSETTTDLKITFLANEGFLIQSGELNVLIDAFIKDEYFGYGALPDDDYKKMISGDEPFENIALALTSHVHLDHFQILPAIDFLKSHSKCEFVSTEQVALKLRHADGAIGLQKQIIAAWPDQKKIRSVTSNGVRTDVFRIRHANPRNYDIQNLGVIIYLGGKKVLHVGDAESKTSNFEWLDFPEKKIDVAILPYWLFNRRRLVEDYVAARHYIAAHVPVTQTAEIKQQLSKSGVKVFEKPMEGWTLTR